MQAETRPASPDGPDASPRPSWSANPMPASDAGPLPDPVSDEAHAAEPVMLPPVASRRPRSRAVPGLLSIAAAIAIGGLAFAAGRMTVGGTTTADAFGGGAGAFPAASGPADRGGFGGGTATVEGTVVSVSDGQLTIETSDGRTVTLATGGSTTYHAQGAASSSEVTTGQSVSVQVAQPVGGPGSSTSGTSSARDVTITGS